WAPAGPMARLTRRALRAPCDSLRSQRLVSGRLLPPLTDCDQVFPPDVQSSRRPEFLMIGVDVRLQSAAPGFIETLVQHANRTKPAHEGVPYLVRTVVVRVADAMLEPQSELAAEEPLDVVRIAPEQRRSGGRRLGPVRGEKREEAGDRAVGRPSRQAGPPAGTAGPPAPSTRR